MSPSSERRFLADRCRFGRPSDDRMTVQSNRVASQISRSRPIWRAADGDRVRRLRSHLRWPYSRGSPYGVPTSYSYSLPARMISAIRRQGFVGTS